MKHIVLPGFLHKGTHQYYCDKLNMSVPLHNRYVFSAQVTVSPVFLIVNQALSGDSDTEDPSTLGPSMP